VPTVQRILSSGNTQALPLCVPYSMSREQDNDPAQHRDQEAPSILASLNTDLDSIVRRRSAETLYSPPNIRRSTHILRYFVTLLVLLLGFAALVAWTYFTQIKPALAQKAESASTPAVARAVEVQLPSQTLDKIAATSSQIIELQKQIDATRALQATQNEQLQKLIERVATTRTESPPPIATTDSAGIATESPATGPFDPPASVGSSELRLIKERNRLTAYADEAISTGLRRPLSLIVDAMRDPERANLYHAGQAEYYRIMGHFQLLNRIDPAYKLPVADLFTKEKIRDEADLNSDQLIALLGNKDHPWQVRLRSAFLLGGRRTPEVGDALVNALATDPSLDVAKEAQLSFEQNVSRHFLLFDVEAVQTWWKTQRAITPSSPAATGN
jgi:hypothetical protein